MIFSPNDKYCAYKDMQLYFLFLYGLAISRDITCPGSLTDLIVLSFGTDPAQTASRSIKNILDNKGSCNAVSARVIKIQLLYYRHEEKIFDHAKLNLRLGGE